MTTNLKTVKDAASLLSCSEITLRRLIAARKIPYHKVGHRYLLSDDDICEYLKSVRIEPVTAGSVPL
jgi:excisionase family DNA binding protein